MLSLYFSFMLQVLSFTLEFAMSKGSEESCKHNLETSVCKSMNHEWFLAYLPVYKHLVPATYVELPAGLPTTIPEGYSSA